ncbi:protein artichoke [Nilaparvata lugens]|uniref:protein artichoke n=1 Tax=Nilaparvata lugens TaxID=108931 RepID=UPI00193DC442|nr:protein artichoke [Nilaparvata lugens]
MQIWCSNSDLASMLAGLKAVASLVKRPIDELIVENNLLPSLPGRAFAELPVVRLMVRDNGLQRVSANWLAGLETTLVEVFIVEPELRSLPDDSLETLSKLEAITIFAGKITRLPTLTNLAALRYLHTQLPLLTELTAGRLQRLPALEQLHVVSSPLLARLEFGVFTDLPRLMLVNFTGCGISAIHPRALTRLPALVELSFSRNRLVDAGAVGRSVRELPNLTVLRLDSNLIDRLVEMSFVDIAPVREIDLSKNRISEIARGAFHRLPALRMLDLSDNRIRRIHPEFFLQPYNSDLEELILVRNRLDHALQLRTILDALPRLKLLDLSYNMIRDINYDSIQGHPTLERLHLDHNHLRQVVREAFSGMPALRELRLSNNFLSNYLEMPLWNLPLLKGLDLSHNEFRRLDRRVLANLPSLRRLDMSSNSLVMIDPASFLGTPSLEHVNLSHNALEAITPPTFPHLANLYELDVGHNRLKTIVPGLPRALEYLYMPNNLLTALPKSPAPDLLLPALRLFDVTGNMLHRLPPESLISLPLLKIFLCGENELQTLGKNALDGLGRLEILDLHGNNILSLDDSVFRDLRRLQQLDLHDNRLEMIKPDLLRENTELKKLDISKNQLSEIHTSALQSNKLIEQFLAAHNSLIDFPMAVTKLEGLKMIDLSSNKLHHLSPDVLGKITSLVELKLSKNKIHSLPEGTFREMPNLAFIDLENNEMEVLASNAIRSLPNLTRVKLGHNKLTSIPSSAFVDLPSLTSAELQENQLSDIASDAFTAVPSLLMLNLSYNQLQGLESAGLHSLKSIEMLDLSHNRIARFASQALPAMDSLVELKMDNNRLCNIQGSPFGKMSHLRSLSLRNNKITSLSEPTFQPLRANIVALDIEGNPLRCSCSLVWLQVWLQEGGQMGPRCHDGTLLREFRMSQLNCQESKAIDTPVPGCEVDVLNPALIEQTQQLSAWLEVKEPVPTAQQRPLPEETDYFYDEYVDYDENATSSNVSQQKHKNHNQQLLNKNQPQLVNQQLLNQNQPQLVNQQLGSAPSGPSESGVAVTISPGVLSHFIPGDTPTLYASTRAPPLQAVNEAAKPASITQPTTAFTFFGVPIPHINIGANEFWNGGNSRDTHGQGRLSGTRGRFQTAEPDDAFTPILPNTVGGFRPIHNPVNNHTATATVETTTRPTQHVPPPAPPPPSPPLNQSRWESRRPVQGTGRVSKLPSPPTNQQIEAEDDLPIETNRNKHHSNDEPRHTKVHNLDQHPFSHSVPHKKQNQDLSQYPHSHIYHQQHVTPTSVKNYVIDSSPEPQTTVKNAVHAGSTPTSPSGLPTSPPKKFKYSVPTTTESATTYLPPAASNNNEISSDVRSSNTKGGPSSLTGFLAPGGQLPPYKPGGRSSITKVTVTPPLGPGPVPMAEDLQGPPPRLAKSPPHHYFPLSSVSSSSQQLTPHNLSNQWYFTNYNKTNLEPFIGPGKQINENSSGTVSSVSTFLIIVTLLHFVSTFFNYQ